jgi:hypothetical protein
LALGRRRTIDCAPCDFIEQGKIGGGCKAVQQMELLL